MSNYIFYIISNPSGTSLTAGWTLEEVEAKKIGYGSEISYKNVLTEETDIWRVPSRQGFQGKAIVIKDSVDKAKLDKGKVEVLLSLLDGTPAIVYAADRSFYAIDCSKPFFRSSFSENQIRFHDMEKCMDMAVGDPSMYLEVESESLAILDQVFGDDTVDPDNDHLVNLTGWPSVWVDDNGNTFTGYPPPDSGTDYPPPTG